MRITRLQFDRLAGRRKALPLPPTRLVHLMHFSQPGQAPDARLHAKAGRGAERKSTPRAQALKPLTAVD